MMKELDNLRDAVKDQSVKLEVAINQVDHYQNEVQQLRQKIIQVEQQLRTVQAPTHLPHDREQAANDQQVGYFSFVLFFFNFFRWRLLGLVFPIYIFIYIFFVISNINLFRLFTFVVTKP